MLHEDETMTAYQAKFRIDRSSTPSQREVSTFYMVSDRADYRLIISNVDDLPVVVKERKDHGQILVDKLLELDGEFFSQLADLTRGTSAPGRPTLAPRPYQTEALTSIVAGLNTSGRGQAILACGAGKTLIGKWVCDRLACDTALIMVPSLALIRQTIGEWHHANTKPFRYRFGFRRAIQEKVICDYQIVVIGVSEEEANRIAPGSEILNTTDSGRWSIEGLAQRIALGKAISTYGIQKIFSFHSRVDAASRFVDGQLSDSFTSLVHRRIHCDFLFA